MTIVARPSLPHKLDTVHNSEQYFRSLDRTLAKKYVEEILRRLAASRQQPVAQRFKPRMELCDDPSSSRVTATLELPGLKRDDLSIMLEENRLLVSGERRSRIPPEKDIADSRYPVKEIKYGQFSRTITVPAGTMMSTVSASLRDGMLEMSWPRNPPSVTRPTATV